MGNLRKVSRKLRRKYGVGIVKLLGAEGAATEVRDAWYDSRSAEWVSNYDKGIQNPNWGRGVTNLAAWYQIVESDVAPILRECVASAYEQARKKYKKVKAQNAEASGATELSTAIRALPIRVVATP